MAAGFFPGLLGGSFSENPDTDQAARMAAMATFLSMMAGRGGNFGQQLGQAGMNGLGAFSGAIAQQEALRKEREDRALRERQIAGQEELRQAQLEQSRFELQAKREAEARRKRMADDFRTQFTRARTPAAAPGGPQVDPTQLPFMKDLQSSGVQTFPVPGPFDAPPPGEREQEMARLTQQAIGGDRPAPPSPYQRLIEQHRQRAYADAERYAGQEQWEKALDALRSADQPPVLDGSKAYLLEDGTVVQAPPKPSDKGPDSRAQQIAALVAQGIRQHDAERITDGVVKVVPTVGGGYAVVDLAEAMRAAGGQPQVAAAPGQPAQPAGMPQQGPQMAPQAPAARPAQPSPYQPAPMPPGTVASTPGFAHVERLDKAVSDLKNDVEKTGIAKFEDTLSEIEGILEKYRGKDIPGFGRAASFLPDALTEADGVKVRQAVQRLINTELKDRSGAAVTDQEYARFLREFGTGRGMPEDALRNAIANTRRAFNETKRNVLAGTNPEVVQEYLRRGGNGRFFAQRGTPEQRNQYVFPDGRQVTFPTRDALLNWMFESGLGPDPRTLQEVPRGR